MFNLIFKENVQGWKHPGSCAFAEPDLLSYRKPNRVVQHEKNGHNNPNTIHNNHDKNHVEIKLYQGNSKMSTRWHSTPDQRTPNMIWITKSIKHMSFIKFITIFIIKFIILDVVLKLRCYQGADTVLDAMWLVILLTVKPSMMPLWPYHVANERIYGTTNDHCWRFSFMH